MQLIDHYKELAFLSDSIAAINMYKLSICEDDKEFLEHRLIKDNNQIMKYKFLNKCGWITSGCLLLLLLVL